MQKKDNSKQDPRSSSSNNPIDRKEEVQQSADQRIDQDFPGYPHNPASEKNINPKTETDEKTANSNRELPSPDKNRQENTQPEIDSDGSANAFERTELRGELERQKSTKENKSNY
jgi:hypothetical protein